MAEETGGGESKERVLICDISCIYVLKVWPTKFFGNVINRLKFC